MPTISYGRSSATFNNVYFEISQGLRFGEVRQDTASRVTLSLGSADYVITGTDLEVRNGHLVGGTIDRLDYSNEFFLLSEFRIDDLGLGVDDLLTAIATDPFELPINTYTRVMNSIGWTVEGSSGNDNVFLANGLPDSGPGGTGDDLFRMRRGNDIAFSGSGDDRLLGGGGSDVLNGGNDDDILLGQGGRDRLVGGSGDDTLSGGGGRDALVGGRGADELTGGGGADTFRFKRGEGTDEITDFNVDIDKIRIGRSDFAFASTGGDLIVTYDGGQIHLTGVDPSEASSLNIA